MKVWILNSSEPEYGYQFAEMVFSTKEAAEKALDDMPPAHEEYSVEEFEVDGAPTERYQRDLADGLVKFRRMAELVPDHYDEPAWFEKNRESCRKWLTEHGYSLDENGENNET